MPTEIAGSITVIIRFLRKRDREQVGALWDALFERLARVARPS